MRFAPLIAICAALGLVALPGAAAEQSPAEQPTAETGATPLPPNSPAVHAPLQAVLLDTNRRLRAAYARNDANAGHAARQELRKLVQAPTAAVRAALVDELVRLDREIARRRALDDPQAWDFQLALQTLLYAIQETEACFEVVRAVFRRPYASPFLQREAAGALTSRLRVGAGIADESQLVAFFTNLALDSDEELRLQGLRGLAGVSPDGPEHFVGLERQLARQLLDRYATAARRPFFKREPYIRMLWHLGAIRQVHIDAFKAAARDPHLPRSTKQRYIRTLQDWGQLTEAEARELLPPPQINLGNLLYRVVSDAVTAAEDAADGESDEDAAR